METIPFSKPQNQISSDKFLKLNFNLKHEIFRFIPLPFQIPIVFLLNKKTKQEIKKLKFYKKLMYSRRKFKSKILYLHENIELIANEFKENELTEKELMDAWIFIFNAVYSTKTSFNLTSEIRNKLGKHSIRIFQDEFDYYSLINFQYLFEALRINNSFKSLSLGFYFLEVDRRHNFRLLCEVLESNKTIEKLGWDSAETHSFTGCSCLFADALKKNKTLKTLELCNLMDKENNIIDFTFICNGIANSESIEEVIFDISFIKDSEEKMQILTNALTTNKNIKKLSFKVYFMEKLKIEQIYLLSNYLRETAHLKEFHFIHPRFGEDQATINFIFSALKANKSIEKFNFPYLKLHHEKTKSMPMFKEILQQNRPRIKYLDLNSNYLGLNEEEMKLLCTGLVYCQALEYLNFSCNSLFKEQGNVVNFSKTISSMKNLKILDVSRNLEISYSHNSEYSKYLLDAVAKSKSIKELNYEKNCLGYSKQAVSSLAQLIVENKSIKKLNLKLNNLGNDEFAHIDLLAESIAKNNTLKFLKISMNHLSKEHLPSISNIILESKSIEKLDISRSHRIYATSEDCELKILADAIAKNKNLKILKMNCNSIGYHPSKLKLLCDAFFENTNLEKVDLFGIGLTKYNDNIKNLKNLIKKTPLRNLKLKLGERKVFKNKRIMKILNHERIIIKK